MGSRSQNTWSGSTDSSNSRRRRAGPKKLAGVALGLVLAATCSFLFAPLDADGQQAGTVPRVGVLGVPPPEDAAYRALLRGLQDLGYVDGKNVAVVFRLGEPSRLPDLASELVRLKVDIIATFGTPAAQAAKRA